MGSRSSTQLRLGLAGALRNRVKCRRATFKTSRKFKPTERIRSCAIPGAAAARTEVSAWGTTRSPVRDPRAGMFSRIAPVYFTAERASTAALISESRTATSSSFGGKLGNTSMESWVQALDDLPGSRSAHTMRRAPAQKPGCAATLGLGMFQPASEPPTWILHSKGPGKSPQTAVIGRTFQVWQLQQRGR